MEGIYLDNAATTQMRKEVVEAILPYFTKKYGNASSLHKFGQEAAEALETSRREIAKAVGALPEEIIFTSGGTESNNLAIKGIASTNKTKGNHIITSTIEHHAVLNVCKHLETNGFKVTYVPADSDGFVSVADVRAAITPKTILISIMHANNEIGTIQSIEAIGMVAKEKGIIFHTDAVQSFGKISTNVKKLGVDALSISSHKIYGPKGVGALYVRRGIPLSPLFHGGPHEFEKRAGTENVAGIVGFATAARLAMKEMNKESKRLSKLRDKLIAKVLEIDGVRLNGHPKKRLPGNANFSFKYIEGEALVMELDRYGIAASTGSACSSKKLEPSHVLLALGLSPEMAHGSLRITLGRYNTEKDTNKIIEILPKAIQRLREISPLKKKKGGEKKEEKKETEE